MHEKPSTLYAKLHGETARISWTELQPFFARGTVLWVDGAHDLVAVAEALADNRRAEVADWLAGARLARLTDEQAERWCAREPVLWAVVVAPWVLAQECAGK
jgi:hypothetical protein